MHPKKDAVSWMEFVKATALRNGTSSNSEWNEVKNVFSAFGALSSAGISMSYLMDYSRGEYLAASDGTKFIVGYDPQDFLRNGLDMVLDHYDKKHFQLFNEDIFPARLKFLKSIPPADHSKYVFTYHFKMSHRKGHHNTLVQRNCFVRSDATGKPLMSFGALFNMTGFINEGPITETIEKTDVTGDDTNVVLKKTYHLHKEHTLFSAREKEVLLWLTEGLSSKQIADKLFISPHTVINHRKSMLQKAGVNNVAALINLAINNRII